MSELPANFQKFTEYFPNISKAHGALGEAVHAAGPLKPMCAHLIQLGASIAIGSEGAVHSHVRRAMEAGASKEQVLHAVALMVSTVGFPRAAAAYQWVTAQLAEMAAKKE